jgi:hypothetical protein
MMETPPEPASPAALEREIARKNIVWGWALFGVFCLLFGGTMLVGIAYLWLD